MVAVNKDTGVPIRYEMPKPPLKVILHFLSDRPHGFAGEGHVGVRLQEFESPT